jgi:phenylacetate-coenzyme A ligase PaaK-like adenylate-forming protein
MIGFSLRTLALRRGRTLDVTRIAPLQRKRLGALVRLAVSKSLFYREKFSEIDLEHFELRDLPTTTKSELMANFDRTVTDLSITRAGLEAFMDDPRNVGERFLDRYIVSHTSGSQGQPMLIVQDQSLVELFFGLQMTRGNAEGSSALQAIRRLIRPKRLAVVTMKRGFYPSASLFQHMPSEAMRYVDVLWLSQTDPNVVDRLNTFRPDTLTAYAGVLEMLALEAEVGRLRLKPELRQVVNNSEALTDRAKSRIESAFGLHVMNNYATGECPFLSNGCSTDAGAHVNADWAILEVVDEENQPVEPDTPGSKVLITNLANHVQPIIRYEVGDIVTMASGPCRCGSRLPRVQRIEGRAADVFWVGNGANRRRLINLLFTHAFEYLTQLREWQAIQIGRNEVLIRLEPLPGATLDLVRARWALDRELAEYGFRDVASQFEVVEHLPPDPRTGKFRRMVSRLDRLDAPETSASQSPVNASSSILTPRR